MRRHLPFVLALAASVATASQAQVDSLRARQQRQSRAAEAAGLAEPFRGIATSAGPRRDLFPIRSTGVTTAPVVEAARRFLASLDGVQRGKTMFGLEDPEWRKWMNQHFYVRQGVGFAEMNDAQREAAFAMVGAGLSAKGLKLAKDIMKLNHTLGELAGNNFDEYGEWLYWVTIMGEPSATEPWGWQLEGHHLIVNYFVLGDQVVMTPLFVGSEPVTAESGKYKGISILQEEQAAGLAMLNALDASQKASAILQGSKTSVNNLTEAWKDNVVIDYAGVPARSFTRAQRDQLLSLVRLFVSNQQEGHARVRMQEVQAHLDSTWFAWIGGVGPEATYYFRIHSPVVLIEFDHQPPAGLRRLLGSAPNRQHIHVVVRTPNGNDYGKDLLRQHYAEHKHPH